MKKTTLFRGLLALALVLGSWALPGIIEANPNICPRIGCPLGYCRTDADCGPGGTCNLFCPKQGCCAY
jgi:hypothetical protein